MSRKLSKHSENVSFQRLKNVQKLLKDNSIDCLLCIQGIDSWYNEGMQEFANYLLLDFFDSYRQDLLSTGSEDDILDDLVLCIKTDSVDICCNPINYRLFLPYFAAWPNFRVFCLSESQYGNQESVLEEFKVKSFVSMLSKCKHVAVPYFSKSQLGESTFDKMKVEKWPLIQAYALEGYGRGIFFTLVHDVIDASLLLSEISGRFDAVSTEKLISEQLLIFESQWEGLGKAVDVARLNKFADGFTDADVIESLHTYYRHGTVGVEPRQEEACFWLKPFCFMGLHTQDIVKRNQAGQPIRADILTAGLSSTQALHMICHGVAPKSGFMCTRTYFFDSSALPPPVGSEVEYRKPDVEQLSRAYKAAIEVTLKSIDEYSTSLQHSQVTEKAKKNVVSKLQKFMDCRKLELEVKLETKLFDGRLESAVDGKAPHTIFVMSVIINNIPSCTATGKSLGAVAFSESFLLSTIKYEKVVGGVPGIHSEVLILTQNVPRWQTWNISSEFEELSSTVEQFIDYKSQDNLSDSIGEFLVDGQPIDIISPYAWMQPIPCRLFLYSEAVIVANDSFGTFTLAKESLKSAHFYDGGGRSVPAFVTFYTSLDLQTKLPTQLQNTSRMVVISISPRSKAYKQFFEQVFEAWKRQEGSDFALSMEETLPESLKAIYEKVAASFKLKLSRPLSKVSYHGTSYPEGQLLNHTGFLAHLSASFNITPGQSVKEGDIPMLLGIHESVDNIMAADKTLAVGESSDVLLTISIISGIPGSYKENLANFITKLTQERSRWVIHKQTPETSHYFDGSKLESSLSYVYNVLKKKANAATKSSRMLIITPGYTDLQTVVNAIKSHPNKELLQHIKIGAVTTCVESSASFLSGYTTVPGVINQCAQGWVNNIVFTNVSESAKHEFSPIQTLIRAVNPSVSFILANKGELTRSQDIELILSDSAFEQQSLRRARFLRQWEPKPSCESYGMNTVILKFKQPLVKQALMSQLKELHRLISESSTIVTTDMKGCVLYASGRTGLVGSSELVEVTYSVVSDTVKITPIQLKTTDKDVSQYMSFVGFYLNEEVLKAMLRSCVPPQPKKKELLSVKTLDRITKKKIHDERHLEPLPSGWFYNGSQYVDMTGERTDRHPEFDRFIQEYVDQHNAEVEEHNSQLDKLSFPDLFE